VAPLLEKAKQCKSLNFKQIQGFLVSEDKQNKWDLAQSARSYPWD